MRKLLAVLLLVVLATPSLAGDYGYRGPRFRGVGLRGAYGSRYDRGDPHAIHARVARYHAFFGHSGRPYWHHPYYLRRYGGLRPYHHYRTFGYRPCAYGGGYYGGYYGRGYHGGYYGGGYYGGHYRNAYYPPAVALAPIYSRLSVVLTLDDAVFHGPAPDRDGLPRAREGLVGKRFLVDLQ